MSVDPVHDNWHPRGQEPLWAESFLSYTYSPAAGVGTWIHLAHLPGAADLWETVLVVTLPDHERLAARVIAPATLTPGRIETAGLTWEILEPFGRCRIAFRGGARRVSAADLDSGPLADGPISGIDLAYEGVAATPPFDYGRSIEGQAWGSGHLELNETCTGRLTLDDRSVALDGIAWRDHSWGPRDFTRFGHHVFLQAFFPHSGRAIMAVGLYPDPPAPHVLLGLLSDRESLTAVQVNRIFSATEHAAHVPLTCELQHETRTARVTAHALADVPVAFMGTSQLGVGAVQAASASHAWVARFARMDWDGETGWGTVERSQPLSEVVVRSR